MFGFLDELSKSIKSDLKDVYSSYKILNVGGCACYVQNYIKIISYTKNKVEIKVKNNTIVIEGIDLIIQELEKNNILLVGKINKTYLLKEMKEDVNVEKK